MVGIVDADCHVIESEIIWEYFDKDQSRRRPALVEFPDPDNGRVVHRWVIDGKLVPKPSGKGGVALATPPMSEKEAVELDWACRSLAAPATRVQHMRQMGVETQVIYPTLFITYLTDDAGLETSLCRAYKRFMAEVWSQGQNHLRWVAVPPLQSIDASIEEMNFAKEHGAVGVLFRGIEGERSLAEPYFYPIYEEASRLNLPVCIHTGAGSSTFTEMCDNRFMSNFAHVRLLPLIAFHDLIHNKIPERFPDLRFGFIEANASWVPFLLHFLRRRMTRRDKLAGGNFGPSLFRDSRIYIATEADEDIPYLLRFIGEDNIVIGSDYGHHDQSLEPELVSVMEARDDVPRPVVDKIMRENPRRLYPIA